MCKNWKDRHGIILLLLLALPLLHGQDVTDSDDDSLQEKSAFISLRVGREGMTQLSLSSSDSLSNAGAIRGFLVTTWGCKLETRQHSLTWLQGLSSEQRAKLEAQWNAASEREFYGSCTRQFQRQGFVTTGTFDFQPLLALLRQDGIESLSVNVSLSKLPGQEISGPELDRSRLAGYYWYVLPVTAQPRPLEVKFGYSRVDLVRMGVFTSLYIFVPVLIVVVMRSLALRRGHSDPAGAWFSFMQTTQLCLNTTFLLWGVTQLNTRTQLTDLATFLGWGEGWRYVIAQLLVFTAPSWTVYVLCTALSYKVFLRIRNVSSTWTQFMLRQLSQIGRVFFPLTLYLAGFLVIIRNFKVGITFFALAWLSALLLVQMYQRFEKSHPSAITSGPLRDRIFGFATLMGVKLQQVFVIPAAQSGVANAFATSKRTIIFTDYLIEKLTQREVDAIAAHELTHLRHNHAQMLGFMYIGALLLPKWILGFASGLIASTLVLTPGAAKFAIQANTALQSDIVQALLMALLLWIYYGIRKKFEFTADAGAVAVTRDPEAMITGLVKISRLNLIPLQWGRKSEAMLTHPSTMRRLERIAKSCNMPEIQLQTLIHGVENTAPGANYSVAVNTPGVVTIGKSTDRAAGRLLILIALHILPVTGFAFYLQRFSPALVSRWWILLAGALGCVAFYQISAMWMGWNRCRKMARLLIEKLRSKASPFRPEDGIPVGFAPAASPRFYVSSYNWDHGLLFFSADKLVFIGCHCSIGLTRDQIHTIFLGQSAPAWRPWPRIYFSWQDKATGTSGVFNLLPLQHKDFLRIDSRSLYQRLRSWRNRQGGISDNVTTSELGPTNFGAVTSMSAKEVGKLSRTLPVTIATIALASGISVFLGLQNAWYVCATVLLIRLFETIPYWRYRERPMVYEACAAKANAVLQTTPEPSLTTGTPPPPPPFVSAPPPPPPVRVNRDPVTVG